MNEPFRVSIVTNGNYFSNLALCQVLGLADSGFEFQVIVTNGLRRQSGSRWSELLQLIRRWGLRYSSYKLLTTLVPIAVARVTNAGISVHQTCKQLGIPYTSLRNVNLAPGVALIESFSPDVLLSYSCPYRLGKKILGIPRITSLNTHSSLLPAYAGVCTYVHVLARNESMTGLTVHEMVERFDAGRIVQQTELPIPPGVSAYALFSAQCELAGRLLAGVLRDIASRREVQGVSQDFERRSYFSEPCAADIAQLRANGFVLIRARELLSLLRGAWRPAT